MVAAAKPVEQPVAEHLCRSQSLLSIDAFQLAVDRLGGGRGDGIHEELLIAWSAPARRYHTLQHLGECLTLAQAWGGALAQAELAQLELALWFHDAVYDTHANDNESLSAAWARSALEQLGISSLDRARVGQMVMATEHSKPMAEGDYLSDLLLDIDLSILGAPSERFAEYEAQIREEYHWVGSTDYVAGRGKVLARFRRAALGDPPTLYRTAHGRTLLAQARSNLATAPL